MKWVWPILVIMLLWLQARLWIGEGSLAQTAALLDGIEDQQHHNEDLRERNRELERELQTWKAGSEGIEEKARQDMGMIRDGETFFLYLPDAGGRHEQ